MLTNSVLYIVTAMYVHAVDCWACINFTPSLNIKTPLDGDCLFPGTVVGIRND